MTKLLIFLHNAWDKKIDNKKYIWCLFIFIFRASVKVKVAENPQKLQIAS